MSLSKPGRVCVELKKEVVYIGKVTNLERYLRVEVHHMRVHEEVGKRVIFLHPSTVFFFD